MFTHLSLVTFSPSRSEVTTNIPSTSSMPGYSYPKGNNGSENISPPKELSLRLDFGVRHILRMREPYGKLAPYGTPSLQGFPINKSNLMLPWSTAPAGFDCSPMRSSNM
ncbi:hypothetical protein TNCV_1272691 [Trichonephila clavipes]|nr:hypothetical protein TNCV_1272691 [Trichonephila clavipes]